MKPVLLIVDDEKSTRSVLCAALEDDYEVYPAANGKAARASTPVKVGDIIEITFGDRTTRAEVLAVEETARKEEAAQLFKFL